MHGFKIFGVLLLLGCGVLSGVLLVSFERRKCRQAQGFVALLRYVRLQVECFSLPVARILEHCDGRILMDCGAEVGSLGDLSALLTDTRLYLPEEFCRLLADFGGQFGGCYRAEQLRCCDYYLERMIPLCDRMRGELPKRERMALILPMAVAAILVLTLL